MEAIYYQRQNKVTDVCEDATHCMFFPEKNSLLAKIGETVVLIDRGEQARRMFHATLKSGADSESIDYLTEAMAVSKKLGEAQYIPRFTQECSSYSHNAEASKKSPGGFDTKSIYQRWSVNFDKIIRVEYTNPEAVHLLEPHFKQVRTQTFEEIEQRALEKIAKAYSVR